MTQENPSWPNPAEESAERTVRRMREHPSSRTVAEIAIDLSKQEGTWEQLAGKSGVPHYPEPAREAGSGSGQDRRRNLDPAGDYEGEWLNSIG